MAGAIVAVPLSGTVLADHWELRWLLASMDSCSLGRDTLGEGPLSLDNARLCFAFVALLTGNLISHAVLALVVLFTPWRELLWPRYFTSWRKCVSSEALLCATFGSASGKYT